MNTEELKPRATEIHRQMVKGIEESAIQLDNDIYGNPAWYVPIFMFNDEKGEWYRPFNAKKYRGKRYGCGWRIETYNLRRSIERAVEEKFNVKFEG